jgi:nifR3 family TIM-barrel protein
LQLGKTDLGIRPLLLAPMEDVTDPSFRLLCKRFGADMVYTEFVNSDGLIRDAASTVAKLRISDQERPVGIQLYGHIIESMVEAARLATEANPEVIDINFGCPVKKIANRGAGSGMMKDVPKMVEMTRQIVNATHLPVTVKTRLGWDEDSKNIVEIAERLQDVGIVALTIHGRTRAQLYRGVADWTLIGSVKNNPRMVIPIVGNGDIDGPEKAKEMFNRYGVDAIMIGRATYGRPWIFREIKHYLDNGVKMIPLTVEEKANLAKEHLNLAISEKGERRAILEMRRHYTCYFKGLPHFKELRLKLVTENEPLKVIELLGDVAKRYEGFTQDESINPSPWSTGDL